MIKADKFCQGCGCGLNLVENYEADLCPKCIKLVNYIQSYPPGPITIARGIKFNKEGSIIMSEGGSMTASREPKNHAIDNQLHVVQGRLNVLHRRLDLLTEEYRGDPTNDLAKESMAPDAPPRPMNALTNDLPKDLAELSSQVDHAIEKVTQLRDLIL